MRTVVVGGQRERRPPSLWELALRLVVNAVGLWLAAVLVPGIQIDDVPSLVAATALFALVNTLVRPLAFLASACFIVLTFGLFIVVINALMLALTAWIAGLLGLGFRVDGFASAIFGALIVALLSLFVSSVLRWRRGPPQAGGPA
ncbi:MAG: phage holin family protein [Chloroflexi bacterium]|nr:phage holin family protein [Chloroflexota bacterium]